MVECRQGAFDLSERPPEGNGEIFTCDACAVLQQRRFEHDVVGRGCARRRCFGVGEELARVEVQAVGKRHERQDREVLELALVALLDGPDDVGVDADDRVRLCGWLRVSHTAVRANRQRCSSS